MGRDLPPFEHTPRPEWAEGDHPRRRYSPLIIFAIAIFGVAAFYLGLVVVTQADEIFFPGNGLKIGFIPAGVVPGVDSGQNPAYADINDRINILVLGLDQRRDEPDDQPYRTDSVMILTIDPYSKTAGIFSIPRDTLVEIPDGYSGYVKDRINVAYEMGQFTYRGYPGGGPGLVKDTIEHNFAIPIDHYAILNFNNFIDIIDELGGIDVNVPEYAWDPAYSDCKYCRLYPVEFAPGLEHMEGERALAYARLRHSDNDFKRIERQQLVMRAMGKKAASLNLFDVPKALDLYLKFKDAVKTDVADLRLAGLARLAQQIGVDNIRTVSMAPATYPCPAALCGGAAMLQWDEQEVEELKASVFNDGRLQVENANVKVLNGTSTPDLAGDFASFLRAQGLSADHIIVDEYADGQLYDTTMIIDVSGASYTVSQLAKWLGLPEGRVIAGTDPAATPFVNSTSNVIVVLGADASVPKSAIAQAGG